MQRSSRTAFVKSLQAVSAARKEKPTSLEVAELSWKSLIQTVVQMPLLFIGCFLALALHSTATFVLSRMHIWKDTETLPLIILVASAQVFLQCILLTPLAVGVQRFVLLGEVRNKLIFLDRATVKSAALLAVLVLATVSAGILVVLKYYFMAMVAFPVLLTVICFTVLVFPAIARNARGSIFDLLRDARQSALGNFWLILFSLLLTVATLYFVGLLVAGFVRPASPLMKSIFHGLDILSVFTTALGAAAVSWLYRYLVQKAQ
jgi:hypothetical protein